VIFIYYFPNENAPLFLFSLPWKKDGSAFYMNWIKGPLDRGGNNGQIEVCLLGNYSNLETLIVQQLGLIRRPEPSLYINVRPYCNSYNPFNSTFRSQWARLSD